MEKDQHKTKVVFRVWKGAKHEKNPVIALFPDIDEGHGDCTSYMHVGQHGAASYAGCIKITRPAKPSEYASLKRELENIGYNLDVRKKR